MARIGILIIDDDVVSQSALRQVLDSEGWNVRIVPVLSDALPELSSGEWSLVIVNVIGMSLTIGLLLAGMPAFRQTASALDGTR